MQFAELMDTVRTAGYDIVDGDGLPVNEEMLATLEEENLEAKQVDIIKKSPPQDVERAIVADVHVSDQVFHIVGNPRHVDELATYLSGISRPQSPPME